MESDHGTIFVLRDFPNSLKCAIEEIFVVHFRSIIHDGFGFSAIINDEYGPHGLIRAYLGYTMTEPFRKAEESYYAGKLGKDIDRDFWHRGD